MKSRFITILMACASASLAHAQTAFNPVPLTQSSYTESIVVPATAQQPLPYLINATTGTGPSKGDNTMFEQTFFGRPGTPGANFGIPMHNTVFTNINNANMTYLMPPSYTNANDLLLLSGFTTGTVTFENSVTVTNLAILCTSGGGGSTVSYVVNHTDSTTDTGTISIPDWFGGGAAVAWGADARVGPGGGVQVVNNSTNNNGAPYLYSDQIAVSGSSPVTSISLTYTPGGGVVNIYAVSGNSAGAAWTPIPLNTSTFNFIVTAAAWPNFPVTATMDQGTNLNNISTDGNMNTFFENGYLATGGGLPASGTSFQSYSQPSHTYQMNSYSTNDAILIDTNHQLVNIVPASPQSYTAYAFLTAGGNIGGGNTMTNIAILQHNDGVNETNLFFGYDWYDQAHPGAIALQANGRINMYDDSINSVGSTPYQFPLLFESYFTLSDSTPVTNIVIKYSTAPGSTATTFIMAVSAATGVISPVVDVGPNPGSVTVLPGQTTNFTVGVSGTQPITGYWQVDVGGTYVMLNDGKDANGSTIIGSHTYTLTISNIYPADATNYEFVASNSAGSDTSPAATLIVPPQAITISPASPVYFTSNNVPLTVSTPAGPAVGYQWYYIDTSGDGVTNLIAGATGSAYTITNVQTTANGYIYGVISTNVYGTNTAQVTLNITDSGAFLSQDLSPTNGEAAGGTPVTYTIQARGNSPIYYTWIVNGQVVPGATNASYTITTPCGNTTIQGTVSNAYGAQLITTAEVTLIGTSIAPLTFNTSGTGWVTNGNTANLPNFNNNVLELTDGNGSEASAAFYGIAQFVGGAWTASYTYNSHAGSADGAAFIIQNVPTGPKSLGGAGGELGYGGISNSLAFQINLYNGNGETPGINGVTNGVTGTYFSAAPNIDVNGTNDIDVVLTWSNSVLSATLTDAVTHDSYTTNYALTSIESIIGGDMGYIGFSGGDGGATSHQTVSNFQFRSLTGGGGAPVSLSVAHGSANAVVLTWPTAATGYALQVSSSLTNPSWAAGPTPTTVGTNNQVTITTGSGSAFYRLNYAGACP